MYFRGASSLPRALNDGSRNVALQRARQTIHCRTSQLASNHQVSESSTCPLNEGNVSPPTGSGAPSIPPGPRSLPIIGTMYKYLPFVGSYKIHDRQGTDYKRYHDYGPVVREEVFPGQVFYYIYDPKLFPEVYSQEGKFPFRFEMTGLKEYKEARGQHLGFPNAKGEAWNKIRQATNRLMRPQLVRAYIKKQNEVAKDMTELLRDSRNSRGEVGGLMDIFYKWGMECISVVIFDTRLGTLNRNLSPESEAHQFVKAANGAFETLYDTTFFWPLHKSKKTKTWQKLCESFDYVYEFAEKHTRECLGQAHNQISDDVNFLKTLSMKSNLNSSEMSAIICDLFYGSVDTVAHALSFALYHLARNPDKLEKLRDEISEYTSPDGDIQPSSMENMKYTKAVLKETLRLTPVSAFGVPRTFDHDFTVGGFHIEAGNTVFLQPNIAAVSAEHFDEPTAFRPERWLRGKNADNANKFPIMSFGHGSRICPGKRFAEQEIYLALINIIRNFELKYEYEDMKMKTRFSNHPDRPLRVAFLDRV